MTKPYSNGDDPFLRDAEEMQTGSQDALAAVVDDLTPVSPSSAGKEKMLNALSSGRFERFSNEVAVLLDIDVEKASLLLDRIDEPKSWDAGIVEGMTIYHVDGGPKLAKAITGFVRMDSGLEFPVHKHLGEENILILQGYYHDQASGEDHGPGDIVTFEAQTEHSFKVLQQSTSLLYLNIVHEGLEVLGEIYRYDDVRL